ncbi:MAG: hypothetical protein RJA22_1937, partial [Verrucomicrobiota bacterium]
NCGVVFWNIPASRDIRRQIVERGRHHFRTIADDQFCLNEVVQTLYYDQLRILPCQYNYRCHFRKRRRNWPTVSHLQGIKIYHNAFSMDAAKAAFHKASAAILPELSKDPQQLTFLQKFWRRLRLRFQPWIIR